MNRVPGGESVSTEQDRFRALDVDELNRKDLVDETEQRIERRLDRVEAPDCGIPMQDLLEYLRIADQLLLASDQRGQRLLRDDLVGMRRSHEIHGHIRVDE